MTMNEEDSGKQKMVIDATFLKIKLDGKLRSWKGFAQVRSVVEKILIFLLLLHLTISKVKKKMTPS